MAVADNLGLAFADTRRALTEFHGAGRRFEVLGEAAGVWVIDDYAHHPSEIRATLAAARQRYSQSEVWAVFQPHTYSRTRALLEGFAQAFKDADHVVVTEIFASREPPDPTLSGRHLAERMAHRDVHFIPELPEAARYLQEHVQPPAVVVTLSAGDGNEVGRLLLEGLSAGEGGNSNGQKAV
jgi:UDP-N-acetylmuramate--alanine ligase